jgi:ubiquitin fusion degradation protein 1
MGITWCTLKMMKNLLIDQGANLKVECATLPVASLLKFEPQSPAFLDVPNPKLVLEDVLRSFACLTTGDVICVHYDNKMYELRVHETRPGPAVSVIDCITICNTEVRRLIAHKVIIIIAI